MSDSYFRGRLFGFEIQHIIPTEVQTGKSLEAERARIFLQSIGVDLDASP